MKNVIEIILAGAAQMMGFWVSPEQTEEQKAIEARVNAYLAKARF